jgi:hypothetical protein
VKLTPLPTRQNKGRFINKTQKSSKTARKKRVNVLSSNTQKITPCGGGLGDAPVSQRGAWGETPQIPVFLNQFHNSSRKCLNTLKKFNENRISHQKQTPHWVGGLGDAPVSQRGVWGETPQALSLSKPKTLLHSWICCNRVTI